MIHCFAVENYERLVLAQNARRKAGFPSEPALCMEDVYSGTIAGLSLSVEPGECVVLQDLENRIFEDLIAVLTGKSGLEHGAIAVGGSAYSAKSRREIAVIQRLAAGTMLFPHLSYSDNLCFTMDHRLPNIWLRRRLKAGIRREYEPWLGWDVFDKPIEDLTPMQRYDLIYARVLLQRPKAALCVQPFMQADVEQRMHIWQLIERLLEKGIAVVILAVNLADTLSLADRLIQIQNGRVLAAYQRSEFGVLPESAPWRYLWQDQKKKDTKEV
jgi:ribose transport system ATP-binding protein